MRFGYVVPEFPGQTHSFFWREITALRASGLQLDLVSTRRPSAGVAVHDWALEASAETYYLSAPACRDVLGALRVLRVLGRRPATFRDVVRCALRTVAEMGDLSPVRRVKAIAEQAGLVMAGALLAHRAEVRDWELVHVHSCANAAQVAHYAHLIAGVQYGLSLHGDTSDYGANQAAKWRHASLATVITQALHKKVKAELVDVPSRLVVSPMGVDTDAFHRRSAYRAWSSGMSALVFSCGRLNPAKGHDVLIRAIGCLRRSGIDARLAIAGEDDVGGSSSYRAVLETLVAEDHLVGAVTLLGALPESRVRDELESSHVFALASHAEPLGVAVMEAMAMEVPVVSTKSGGVPELVENGRTGVLVPPGDVDALASALAQLLSDPVTATAYGARGRARARAQFDSRATAAAFAALVRSAAVDLEASRNTDLPICAPCFSKPIV